MRCPQRERAHTPGLCEFIDYKTSMVTDEDPLRGLFFYHDLGFSHTLHVLKETRSVPSHQETRCVQHSMAQRVILNEAYEFLVSSSLLGPVDPSFRALSGRLKFTVRRHKFNKDILS